MGDYKEFVLKQREAQSKWDYFFISISFAFIVITYQAYNNDASKGFEYLALISWLSMLTSALIGLYRLRRIYAFMGIESDNIGATERGEKTPEFIEVYKKVSTKEQKKIHISNGFQITLFGLGTFAYVLFLCCNIYPFFFGFLSLVN